MYLSTSMDCGVYILMWLPFLIIVIANGYGSLHRQVKAQTKLKNIGIWQVCSLVVTGAAGMIMHYVGLSQLSEVSADERRTNPNWWEDGMSIVRFVDVGYFVIFGIGVLFLIATSVIGYAKMKDAQQVAGGNGV